MSIRLFHDWSNELKIIIAGLKLIVLSSGVYKFHRYFFFKFYIFYTFITFILILTFCASD